LGTEKINLVEDHFAVPLGKADVLRAPKHFPAAVCRYEKFFNFFNSENIEDFPNEKILIFLENTIRIFL
jgi:hypothetical protein